MNAQVHSFLFPSQYFLLTHSFRRKATADVIPYTLRQNCEPKILTCLLLEAAMRHRIQTLRYISERANWLILPRPSELNLANRNSLVKLNHKKTSARTFYSRTSSRRFNLTIYIHRKTGK